MARVTTGERVKEFFELNPSATAKDACRELDLFSSGVYYWIDKFGINPAPCPRKIRTPRPIVPKVNPKIELLQGLYDSSPSATIKDACIAAKCGPGTIRIWERKLGIKFLRKTRADYCDNGNRFDYSQRNEEMCDLRRRGLTLQEIGDRYGLTREHVRNVTCAAVSPKKPKELLILSHYSADKTIAQIARDSGCTWGSVHHQLIKNGLPYLKGFGQGNHGRRPNTLRSKVEKMVKEGKTEREIINALEGKVSSILKEISYAKSIAKKTKSNE